MRVCSVAQGDVTPVIGQVLESTVGILATVAQNPRNAGFNHSLFETIACLVRFVCQQDRASVAQFEQFLFPHFQTVLGMENCDEFAPYIFQILAQLLEFRAVGDVSPAYASIFPALLVPAVWENNVWFSFLLVSFSNYSIPL
jgi:exportin-2 (importin alpha re-exporter)